MRDDGEREMWKEKLSGRGKERTKEQERKTGEGMMRKQKMWEKRWENAEKPNVQTQRNQVSKHKD